MQQLYKQCIKNHKKSIEFSLSTWIRSETKLSQLSLYTILQSLFCNTPTQSLTKITSYTLKRIAFTTSRASEMKARAMEALSSNLYSEKYIRILQMLETQLKRNRKGNPLFYYSPLHLSSMMLPYCHDNHHLPVLYTFWT